MTPTNLGVVFGPTLMKTPADKQPTTSFDMADSSNKCNVVEYLVIHALTLFAANPVIVTIDSATADSLPASSEIPPAPSHEDVTTRYKLDEDKQI